MAVVFKCDRCLRTGTRPINEEGKAIEVHILSSVDFAKKRPESELVNDKGDVMFELCQGCADRLDSFFQDITS
jgi:hypothetical protein